MQNPTFWQWLTYAILGLFTISFLPEKSRPILIVVIVLGGLLWMRRNSGSGDPLQSIIDTITKG